MKVSDKRLRSGKSGSGKLGWLAMGTLAAYAAVGSSEFAMAAVAKEAAATPAEPPAANLAVKRFNIPAGPLDAGFKEFEAQSGMKISTPTSLTAAAVAGFQTKGVTGQHTIAEGLRMLLEGTGLQYAQKDTDTLVVGLRNSEEVNVTSSAPSVALSQFTEPLRDVAQTVNVIPQFILQEQAVTSLRDGLRNAPGISIAAGEGGAQGDNLTIRGFSARNDIFLDGVRDFGSYYRDSFDYEAIEVLQGPASVEFGRGSTGGVVNQESKQAHLHENISGTLQLGTNLMRRISADVNEPLSGLGDGSAFRLNVVGSQSKVAERDVAENRRFGIAPSLAFGLKSPTRYYIHYLHESENSTPDYGLPYFLNSVAQVNRRNYYGFANDNYLRTNPDVVTGKVEHDFKLPITVQSKLRWGNYPRDVRITEPQIPSTPTFSTVNGVRMVACPPPACYPSNYDINLVQVRRAEIPVKSVEDILWSQSSATGRMRFKRVENTMVVMVEGGRERSNPQRTTYTVPNTTAVNPNPNDPFAPTVATLGAKTHVLSTAYGVNFLDTLKLTEWLQFSGGVRFDYFNTNSLTDAIGTTPVVNVSRLDKQPTYRAAVIVKPRPNGSVYFDYGTSFNPSGESLSLSANNATLAPELNSTTEVGTKWDFLRERLSVSGSYFATEKQNARETDPTNTLNTILVGTQLVRGAQVAVIGHMPRHFDVIAGYAYLNGRVESSILNASPFSSQYIKGDPIYGAYPYFYSPKGFPFANVPKNSGNLWVTHDLWFRFVGGFGGNYVSARRASSTAQTAVYNSVAPVPVTSVPVAFKSIPGYWVFNAMVRRPISDHVDFQANVINLANKFYIDQPHPNHLIPGEGLNAQVGFNYKF